MPTGVGTAEYNWLKNNLASFSPRTCTILYYHHPYFNIGSDGQAPGISTIWQLAAQYQADIVLTAGTIMTTGPGRRWTARGLSIRKESLNLS